MTSISCGFPATWHRWPSSTKNKWPSSTKTSDLLVPGWDIGQIYRQGVISLQLQIRGTCLHLTELVLILVILGQNDMYFMWFPSHLTQVTLQYQEQVTFQYQEVTSSYLDGTFDKVPPTPLSTALWCVVQIQILYCINSHQPGRS